nr:MAG TPA: hypothetical protein [Caudoviricetes sp.]
MNRYELSAYAIAVSNFLKNNASAGKERIPITVNEWELATQLDKLAQELQTLDKN